MKTKLSMLRSHDKYGVENSYHSYHYRFQGAHDRKLLLLHGSRLAGLDTWGRVMPHLQAWSEVLVPDLPGVGADNPCNKTDHDFTLPMIVDSLKNLIDKYHWVEFDVVSYSMSGLIAKIFQQTYPDLVLNQLMIESAILVATEKNLPIVGNKMHEIADVMLCDPKKANQEFSSLVNGNQRKVSLSTNVRPIYNSLGFANLLRLLGNICLSDQVRPLIDAQKNTTAIITEYASDEAKIMVKQVVKRCAWGVIYVEKFNHSFVFIDPKMTADLLNNWGENGGAQ